MSADQPSVKVSEEAKRAALLVWSGYQRASPPGDPEYTLLCALQTALAVEAPAIAAKAVEEGVDLLEKRLLDGDFPERLERTIRADAIQKERERLEPVISAAREWLQQEHAGNRPAHPSDRPAARLHAALAALQGDDDA